MISFSITETEEGYRCIIPGAVPGVYMAVIKRGQERIIRILIIEP